MSYEDVARLTGWTAREPHIPQLTMQEELVTRVTEVDRRLVQLFDLRLEAALTADCQKDLLGMPVLAPRREMAVADRAREENERFGGVLDNSDIYQWYSCIMRATRTQQLQERRRRGTITKDEQYILNQVVGGSEPSTNLPAETRKTVSEDDEQAAIEQLMDSRWRIDALDIAIVHRLMQRQRAMLELSTPVPAGQTLHVVQTERKGDGMRNSRLDILDLLNLFDAIAKGMYRRKLDLREVF